MSKRTFDDKFAVGDGVHTSNNGDRYPYRIVWVSKSGKQIRVMPMEHRAIPTADGTLRPYGHDEWEVTNDDEIDYSNPDQGETYVLRKNGKWIAKGAPLTAYWCGIHPEACYSYNPHV